MHDELDRYTASLGKLAVAAPATERRPVQSLDKTREREVPGVYDGVDALFNQSAAYQRYQKEMPQHRLILWYCINGHKIADIAARLGITKQTIYEVRKQPWFQEAFCKITTELGKDTVKTFLQGEILPALQRTAHLAEYSESDAVKLAANKELMDRFLGKSTVKVESKSSGTIDHLVYDAQKLLEEDRKLTEQLNARGLGGMN